MSAEGVDIFQGFFAEGFGDARAGFVQVGGAGGHVVGVRAEEVDVAVLQEAHGLSSCFEGQEELGVRLHQNAEIQELIPDRDGLVEEIALDMGHQELYIPAPGQVADLARHVAGPGLEGHLKQEELCPLQAERRELFHIGNAGIVEHLGTEENTRGILREDLTQPVPGFLPAKEETLDGTLGRIEVRGGTDGVGALLLQGIEHQEAGGGILAAVVDPGEDMAVKVDHSAFCSCSAGSAETSSSLTGSAVASRKAFCLASAFLDLGEAVS